jgi:hypothetical protein
MPAIDAQPIRVILGSIGIVLSYGFSLYRIFQRNRGDRFIEFGLITTMLLIIMFALSKLPNIPDWVVPAFWPLLALFCFLSFFFMFQQIYQALRNRKRDT